MSDTLTRRQFLALNLAEQMAYRKAKQKEKSLNKVAKRQFTASGHLYHTGTLAQWFEFKKELDALRTKYGITHHCFGFSLLRVNDNYTPASAPDGWDIKKR